MRRDSSGVVWYSGCYGQVAPFNGIHCDELGLKLPEPLQHALSSNHPIAKSSLPIQRSLVRALIEKFRTYEKNDVHSHPVVEELEYQSNLNAN